MECSETTHDRDRVTLVRHTRRQDSTEDSNVGRRDSGVVGVVRRRLGRVAVDDEAASREVGRRVVGALRREDGTELRDRGVRVVADHDVPADGSGTVADGGTGWRRRSD